MLKRIFFAVAPLMLIAGTVVADDDLLSAVAKLDADKPTAAETEEMDDLGQADVDALLGEGEEEGEEAIAACFRRIRYGYGYRSFGYRGYGHCSYRFYRPVSLHELSLVPLPTGIQHLLHVVLHTDLLQLLGVLVIETWAGAFRTHHPFHQARQPARSWLSGFF